MAAVIKFGEGGLHGAVATVDDQHLGLHAGDRPERLADLLDLFDFIVEDFRMPCAKAPHLRQQRSVARSEEHTSELQSLMRISYAVFCLKKKKNKDTNRNQRLSYIITTTRQ